MTPPLRRAEVLAAPAAAPDQRQAVRRKGRGSIGERFGSAPSYASSRRCNGRPARRRVGSTAPPRVPIAVPDQRQAIEPTMPAAAVSKPAIEIAPSAAARAAGGDDASATDADDDAATADRPPELPAAGERGRGAPTSSSVTTMSFLDQDPADRNAQIYFGGGALGSPAASSDGHRARSRSWSPRGRSRHQAVGAGRRRRRHRRRRNRSPAKATAALPESPADRLSLTGKSRAHAEKCLADAVYFEARGEPLQGQRRSPRSS